MKNQNVYRETQEGVEKHLSELKAALQSDECVLDILFKKRGQAETDPCSTIFTMNELEYDMADVRRELQSLTIADYKENMKDSKRPDSEPFFVFGKCIARREVYIKEKLRSNSKIFCISFHFAEFPLKSSPYIKRF